MTGPLDPAIERHETLAVILPWILNDSPTSKLSHYCKRKPGSFSLHPDSYFALTCLPIRTNMSFVVKFLSQGG